MQSLMAQELASRTVLERTTAQLSEPSATGPKIGRFGRLILNRPKNRPPRKSKQEKMLRSDRTVRTVRTVFAQMIQRLKRENYDRRRSARPLSGTRSDPLCPRRAVAIPWPQGRLDRQSAPDGGRPP